MAKKDETDGRVLSGASEPLTLEEEIESQPGVPKTPSGWWTLGLTVMGVLIAIALWLRYF